MHINDEKEVELCKEASKLDSAEQQGYFLGPMLCEKLSMTSEQLLYYIVAMAGVVETQDGKEIHIDNVRRDIGVIRWCLDQRPKVN